MFRWLRKKLGIEQLELDVAVNTMAIEVLEEIVLPPEPPDGHYVWDRKQPRENWPASIAGIKVGYVQVGVAKSPLYELVGNIPKVLERMSLRGGITTDAKRIIAKAPYWFMVMANGDVWGAVLENGQQSKVRPFGEQIDGDDLWFKVMHEQVIDGIVLIDEDLPEVFLHFNDIIDTFLPG